MAEPVRTFLAVAVPPTEAVQVVLDELRTHGREVKAVAACNLHVTLKFLGDTRASQIDEIVRIMRAVAAQESPFSFRVCGLGAFPSRSRPSVLWAGIADGEPLARLATALETALAPLGFAPEERSFTPHLTLARIKARPPRSLDAIFARHKVTEFVTVAVDRIALYRSDPGVDGPVYTAISDGMLEGGKSE